MLVILPCSTSYLRRVDAWMTILGERGLSVSGASEPFFNAVLRVLDLVEPQGFDDPYG